MTVTIDMLQHLTTLATAVLSAFGAVAWLAWWLSSKLNDLKNRALADLAEVKLEGQKRHEENLARFTDIAVALARMGNGGFSERR